MDKFNLNTQYSLYLQRVGLSEQVMMPIQAQETKRAFMGACGQMLDLLTDGMGSMKEEEALSKLESLFVQVNDFWQEEINQHLENRMPDPDAITLIMQSPANN